MAEWPLDALQAEGDEEEHAVEPDQGRDNHDQPGVKLGRHEQPQRDVRRVDRVFIPFPDDAGQGRQGEAGGADEEDPLAAEVVSQLAAGDQAHRQRQQVGVGHPLQARQAGAEVGAHGRVGDRHDGAVQGHHHQAE